jgi:DNA-binding response OmpR family regulator
MPRSPLQILSISADPDLGKLRAMVLRKAGHEVSWPSSKSEADALLRDRKFDLLLLGHSISGPSAREFADVFRARNPGGKIIVVMAASYSLVKPDRTVRPIDGPEVLLETINALMDEG